MNNQEQQKLINTLFDKVSILIQAFEDLPLPSYSVCDFTDQGNCINEIRNTLSELEKLKLEYEATKS